jgi:hypothetical protein
MGRQRGVGAAWVPKNPRTEPGEQIWGRGRGRTRGGPGPGVGRRVGPGGGRDRFKGTRGRRLPLGEKSGRGGRVATGLQDVPHRRRGRKKKGIPLLNHTGPAGERAVLRRWVPAKNNKRKTKPDPRGARGGAGKELGTRDQGKGHGHPKGPGRQGVDKLFSDPGIGGQNRRADKGTEGGVASAGRPPTRGETGEVAAEVRMGRLGTRVPAGGQKRGGKAAGGGGGGPLCSTEGGACAFPRAHPGAGRDPPGPQRRKRDGVSTPRAGVRAGAKGEAGGARGSTGGGAGSRLPGQPRALFRFVWPGVGLGPAPPALRRKTNPDGANSG